MERGEEAAEALAQAIATDWRGAALDAVDRGLCEFAAALTHRQHEMAPRHLDALRALGLDDRAIHDAAQVTGYFNYITRVADSLGVKPEAHIPLRGRDRR
jgi:uncharacterized peroxidase-related enzyme